MLSIEAYLMNVLIYYVKESQMISPSQKCESSLSADFLNLKNSIGRYEQRL